MSYILEALKRSEQERNQSELPDFRQDNALLYQQPARKPWWPLALILVLTLNAMVFLYIHLSGSVDEQAGSADLASDIPFEENHLSSVTKATDTPNSPSPVSKLDPVLDDTHAVLSTEMNSSKVPNPSVLEPVSAPSARNAAAGSKTQRSVEPLVTAPQKSNETVLRDHASVKQESDFETVATQGYVELETQTDARVVVANEPLDRLPDAKPESLYKDTPFLFNLPERSRPNVPKLVFNSHIFSDNPSARRVMINNIYLREGQVFSGMQVLEIGELDVVFEKSGTQFKLPAMRDWRG
jgi:general secretion pathway protein B